MRQRSQLHPQLLNGDDLNLFIQGIGFFHRRYQPGLFDFEVFACLPESTRQARRGGEFGLDGVSPAAQGDRQIQFCARGRAVKPDIGAGRGMGKYLFERERFVAWYRSFYE